VAHGDDGKQRRDLLLVQPGGHLFGLKLILYVFWNVRLGVDLQLRQHHDAVLVQVRLAALAFDHEVEEHPVFQLRILEGLLPRRTAEEYGRAARPQLLRGPRHAFQFSASELRVSASGSLRQASTSSSLKLALHFSNCRPTSPKGTSVVLSASLASIGQK